MTRIEEEIREATGSEVKTFQYEGGTALLFEYKVTSGNLQGQTVITGVSMAGGQEYPALPPHFIHAPEGMSDGRSGPHHTYTYEGKNYGAFSREVGGWWDKLQKKSMKAYIHTHLAAFWRLAT